MKSKILILIVYFFYGKLLPASIEWDRSENAEFYRIEAVNAAGETVQRIETRETRADLHLDKPGRYQYRVGASDSAGRTAWSEWVDLRVQFLPDEKPKENITLEWESQKETDFYTVQLADETNKIIHEEGTSVSRISLKLGEGKYRYRVASSNELGTKAWSDWNQFEVRIRKKEIPPAKETAVKNAVCERCQVFWRSSLLPGWGQHYRKDSRIRVIGYPILASSFLAVYLLNHENNKNSEKKYNKSLNDMLLLQSDSSGNSTLMSMYAYTKLANESAETKSTFSRGSAVLSVLAGIYLFNLADALFFYDYSVPIAERYSLQKISFQMQKDESLYSAESKYILQYSVPF